MAGPDWEIRLLADRRNAIPNLAAMFVAAWEPFYGPDGPGDAKTDLEKCLNRNTLPIAFVAFDPAGNTIGTAALKETSISERSDLGPWLAALVVAPEHRGMGLASALAARVEKIAGDLGYKRLYTAMSHKELKVLHRNGWQPIDTVPTLRHPATVFELEIGRSP